MRLFVYEHLSAGGGLEATLPQSLHAEGWTMLRALLEDAIQLPNSDVHTLLGKPLPVPKGVHVASCQTWTEEERLFRGLARADWTIVVAPESDGVLETRARWVEESGGRLLGPTRDAIRLTADKLALCRHLLTCGIRTPATISQDGAAFDRAMVWKPRFGAGSQATFTISDSGNWARAQQLAIAEGWQGESILQEFVSGLPASVACLVGPNGVFPLLPAEQSLSADGRFHYLGGRLPLAPDLAVRARTLAVSAVRSVPGLLGYVGVDLVLGEVDAVIEINPRLTTSYVGLRELAEGNLVGAMIQTALGAAPDLRWKAGRLDFSSDGTLDLHASTGAAAADDMAPNLAGTKS